MRTYLILILKGVGMGAADVVPGVSGGTIAFITGIYEELLDSLKGLPNAVFKDLIKFRFVEFRKSANLDFLIPLFVGIGISVLSLSRLILYLLEHHPILLWSFFFGLIIASAILVFKEIEKIKPVVYISTLVGIGVAWWITSAAPSHTPEALWFIFLSGFIAICAMILPGISGSFILLLMGKYEYILGAIKDLNIWVILVFGLGCISGLLSFSHVLSWLLKKYHAMTVGLLAGFMIGSLNKVWPWKETLETITNRHGKIIPLLERNILPATFEQLSGESAQLISAIIFCIVGFGFVLGIEKLAEKMNR